MLNAAVFPLYKVPLDLVSMTQSHVLFNFPLQANQSDVGANVTMFAVSKNASSSPWYKLKGKMYHNTCD